MDKKIFETIAARKGLASQKAVEGSRISSFAWRCITDGYKTDYQDDSHHADALKFLEHWEAAKNEEAFICAVIRDRSLACTQGYGELLDGRRELPGWWFEEFPPEHIIETLADAGSVKAGNDGFTILLNAGGDGWKTVAVYDKRVVNDSVFRCMTSIEGEDFNIYSYDCGDEVALTLSGRYGVYARFNDGVVVLERWG